MSCIATVSPQLNAVGQLPVRRLLCTIIHGARLADVGGAQVARGHCDISEVPRATVVDTSVSNNDILSEEISRRGQSSCGSVVAST